MSPRHLFVYVIGSNNLRAPEKYRESMKQTKIGVPNSERTDRDSATELLEFTNASGSPSEYTWGLLLRMHDGEWKVLSNAVDARK